MNILKFKTNIESSNNVHTVSRFIDRITNIVNWEVETQSPEKWLVVRGKNIEAAMVIKAVKRAGYQIYKNPLN